MHTSPKRTALANPAVLLAILGSMGLLVALCGLAMLLRGDSPIPVSALRTTPPKVDLVFRCAAGIQPPCDRVMTEYHQLYPHVRIEVDYQGSGTLLESIRVERQGGDPRSDLYLAADETYVRKGKQDGLLSESIPVAYQQPVIAVKKGNPKGIQRLADLLRDDVAIAIADPDGAAIGRATKKIAQQQGLWDQIAAKRKLMVTKIPELVNAIKIGNKIDAALIWDANVAQVPELDGVSFEGADEGRSEILISVVSTCRQPSEALRFARFLASRDRGQPHFVQQHYQPVEADLWSERPQVRLYAGSMFQAGVEETITRFEQREGVTVERIYNGCGILVSQMQAGGRPEAYLSCDQSYMDKVSDRFRRQTRISENDIVMVVKKGNPKGIHVLRDLAGDGLRLGLCHPTDSALGYLTKRLLTHSQLESLYEDPALMVATGPMLINAIAAGDTGGLDAALVYRSNVMSNRDNLKNVDIVDIDDGNAGLAVATQPWAIAKETDNARLLERLYDKIASDSSRQLFTSAGFRWLLD